MTASETPAVYQPLPQASDVADELQDEEDIREHPSLEPVHVDGRIRWVHFIFGCAVLLPWNGR